MTIPIVPLPPRARDEARDSEAEIIRRRIASLAKWRSRRQLLRLRVALFGRRKHGLPGQPYLTSARSGLRGFSRSLGQ